MQFAGKILGSGIGKVVEQVGGVVDEFTMSLEENEALRVPCGWSEPALYIL
jgi:hypothetical protein